MVQLFFNFVRFQKIIVLGRPDYGGQRKGNRHLRKTAANSKHVHERIQECQPATFAAHRAFGKAYNLGPVRDVPFANVNDSAPVRVALNLVEDLQQISADVVNGIELGNGQRLDSSGKIDLAVCHQPARVVIVSAVIQQTFVRDLAKRINEFGNIGYPRYFPAARHPEHEIPETELMHNEIFQFRQKVGRVLIHKSGAKNFRPVTIARLA